VGERECNKRGAKWVQRHPGCRRGLEEAQPASVREATLTLPGWETRQNALRLAEGAELAQGERRAVGQRHVAYVLVRIRPDGQAGIGLATLHETGWSSRIMAASLACGVSRA
jgi:hypothetical protein